MSARNLPGVGAIRPGDLSAYLLGAGWTRAGDDPWGAAIFTRTVAVPPDPEDKDLPPWEEVRVRVLSDTSLSDYDQRMGEVVDRLAQVEGRPALLVLNDLLLPPADIARFRVHGEGMASGAVSLLAGVRLRQAIGQLVLAAAHSALQPRSHHPRLSLGPAMELLHGCVEGPYERSSFVASVVVPVPPAIGSELDEDPYPRRVTRMLMEGLQAAAQAVEQGNPGSLLDLSARGVSANFLEALSELAPPSDRAVVEATVSWSRTRPTPATTPARVQLRAESFSAFAEAARVLRARRVVPGTELVGFVVSVSRPDNDLTQPGTVMLACDLDGVEGPTKVRMTLPSSSYQQAVEAHARAGRVRATGTLYKSGRSWSLQDVSAFEALPSIDDG